MANTYKNIVITPNKGSSTGDPTIVFSGANTTVNTDITLRAYPTSNGTLSFEGSAGQLFSITNDLTGTLFSVNDISGMPSIEVDANGKITLAQYSGNVGIGTGSPAYKLDVAGDMRVTGNVIMGDASTDTITLNGSVISLGNNQSIDSGTLFIDATNNEVGIGTTSPTSNLHVIGTANITSSVVIGTTNVVPTIQAAFLAANSAFANANTTHTLAIASFGAANASFANGNTNFTTLQTVFGVANAAFLAANSAFANANGTHTLTVASFGAANASFANGNTNFTVLQTVFGAANAAFANANSTHTLTVAAFGAANAAFSASNSKTSLLRRDLRTIYPANTTNGYVEVGFTTWNNNALSPYADFVHLRTYTDASGGGDNLLTFRKDAIGMRLWQHSYFATTPYSTYKDVAFTSDLATGNAAIIQANTARDHANAAFANANTTHTLSIAAFANANATHTLTIASFNAANASFANGNTNFTVLQTVFGVANAAFLAANSAFANANGTHTLTIASFGAANAAFSNANTTHTLTIEAFSAANAAFANANTTHTLSIASFSAANASFANGNTNFTVLQTVFGAANAAFANANSTHTLTISAFAAANASFANANSTHTLTIASFDAANAAFSAANASFANGNTNFTTLQTVFGVANAAFSNANTTHTLAIAAFTQANTANNLTVANTGTVVGSRNILNFIPGGNVTISFADDAAGNRVNVTIAATGSSGGGGGGLSFTSNVGDAVANTFNITHALNSTTIIPAVRERSTGYYVYPDMKVTSPNNIVLEFVSAPTTNQYFLIVLGV